MELQKNVKKQTAVIILAAGLGTRMKSDKAKVLHEVAGRSMILYVVEAATKAVGDHVILVVGHQADKVRAVVSAEQSVAFANQEKQLGTGHAVLCAVPYLSPEIEDIVILCGDVPLLMPETIQRLMSDHANADRDLTVLAVEMADPKGYGRILLDEDRNLLKIVEQADATEQEKKVRTVNSGIYCVKKEFLCESLEKINTNNAQGEFYLTDIIEIGYIGKKVLGVIVGASAEETTGVNSREDLAEADFLMRRRHDETS